MRRPPNQIIDSLPLNLYTDINPPQPLTAHPIHDIINHLTIPYPLEQPPLLITDGLPSLLNPRTVIRHVTVLIGGKQCDFGEPFDAFLFGELVDEGVLDLLAVLQAQLLHGCAFLHGVDQPEAGVD